MKTTIIATGSIVAIGLAALLAVVLPSEVFSTLVSVAVGGLCIGGPALAVAGAAIFVNLRRNGQQGEKGGAQAYPPVIVVQGADTRQLPYGAPQVPSLPAPNGPRSFKVVGSDAQQDVHEAEWRNLS